MKSPGTKEHESGGDDRSDGDGANPSEENLGEELPVDRLGSSDQSDSDGSSDLALRGRDGESDPGGDDDDEGGRQFDEETSAGCDGDEVHADGGHDLVSHGGETDDDTEGSEGEDPRGRGRGVADLSRLVDGDTGGEGSDGVGDVVGTVREGVEDGGEDLEGDEDTLSLGVVHLRVLVHLRHLRVALQTLEHVHVALLRRRLIGGSFGRWDSDGGLGGCGGFRGGLLRVGEKRVGGLLANLVHDVLAATTEMGDEGEVEDEADEKGDAEGDEDGLRERWSDRDPRAAMIDDDEDVDSQGEGDHGREEVQRILKRFLFLQNTRTHAGKEQKRNTTRDDRRIEPG